ncbi:ferritin-like domain-containing protein, partial [Streptococcus pluranimalium]
RLERLAEVYRYLSDLFQEGLAVSDEEGDDPSNDIFSDAQASIQKTLWMLEAEIGRSTSL